MKNIQFLSENFLFLEVKFPMYMNRRVFVMTICMQTDLLNDIQYTDALQAGVEFYCNHIRRVTLTSKLLHYIFLSILDTCEYTLYDLKYNMPIWPTLNTDNLMEADSMMWCEQGDKYIPFYTPTERCLNNLMVFCKSHASCKYEKRQRKELKNKGDLKKECWRNFVLG